MFGLPFSQAPFSTLGYVTVRVTQSEVVNAVDTTDRTAQQAASVFDLLLASSAASSSMVAQASAVQFLPVSSYQSSSLIASAYVADLLSSASSASAVALANSAVFEISTVTSQTSTASMVASAGVLEQGSLRADSSVSKIANSSLLEVLSASSGVAASLIAQVSVLEILSLADLAAASGYSSASVSELSNALASVDRTAQQFASTADLLSVLDLISSATLANVSVFELNNASILQSSGVRQSVTDALTAYELSLSSMLASSSVTELSPVFSTTASSLVATASAVELLSALELSWATTLLNATSPPKDFASRLVIQPVDSFIKAGFAEQMKRQFRCPAIFVSSTDRIRNLQALIGNKTPSYPYIFLSIQSVSSSQDSYMSHRMARGGVPVSLNSDNNQIQTARLVPANFEIEVTYVTNKYSGEGTESVEGYIRRWLFARRIGSMNFNIDYGLTQLSISYSVTDSAPVPVRENPADAESVYMFTSVITLHGFTSEPELGSVGKINQIQLVSGHPAGSGQFFAF